MTLPPSSLWPKMLLAALIGVPSALMASWLGMPLPWMLGPMLGCGVAALAGARVSAPGWLRPLVMPIIGVMLGSGFHPEILDHMFTWTGTLLMLPLFLLVATAVSFTFYRVVGGYDPVTAFFSAAPGGLNDMVLMGGEAGGDETKIALAHALRVFLVISAIALVFAVALNIRAVRGPGSWVGLNDLSLSDIVLLTACAILGILLGKALRLPARQMFGPMLLSAAAHLTGIVTVPPPTLLVIISQITIGTMLGCRFAGISLKTMGRDLVLGLVATLLLLGVTTVFAALLGPLTGTSLSQGVLAFSPGGLTEMSLLALSMHQDVAYVSTSHIARIVLVIFGMQILFRAIGKRLTSAPKDKN